MDAIRDLILHSGPVARVVVAILAAFSVISWGLIVDRWLHFRRAQKHCLGFYASFSKASKLSEIVESAKEAHPSPLRALFLETYKDFHAQVRGGTSSGSLRPAIQHVSNLERTLDRASEAELDGLSVGLTLLATISSAAPFVGLFGTVWGIMEAFRGITAQGSTSLVAVAPGIADALITTAGGLFAAIPALMAYNLFQRRLEAFRSLMRRYSLDLLNFLVVHYG